MEELQYKQDIVQTRTGNLGSSDAKLLMQIAELGAVPKSAMKRLAIVKGFIENPEISNAAMRFGDYIENMVYESLKSQDQRWQSNPCLVSKVYSRENCGVIDHVDFLLQDDEKKVLMLAECKASKYSFEQTRRTYEAQLMHHHLLGLEMAKELGGYRVQVLLCHYQTEGLNLEEGFTFDPDRLTVKPCRFGKSKSVYDLGKAMDVVSEFLTTFEGYQAGEEVEYQYLPAEVKTKFDEATTMLMEIKAREEAVNAFKTKLYDFMAENGIKSIKNDTWSITCVDPSESRSFDSKKFMEDFAREHPRKAPKLKEKYTKVSKKKGYVTIKIKDNKEE